MGLVLAILSTLTGGTKSVSVCGINAAEVAQPSRRRIEIAAYLVSLYAGAAAVVLLFAGVGRWFVATLHLGVARLLAVSSMLLALGVGEMVHGPWLLPHILWAMPRAWAERPRYGLPLFGFIRGLAVLNHSPFASMHAWMGVGTSC